MSSWWFGGWLVIYLFVNVNSNVDLDAALSLAHCRASCLHEMNISHVTQQRCRRSLDCSQCWDVCRMLQTSDNIETFCADDRCVGGCLGACRLVSTRLPPPMLLTKPLEKLTFTASTVSWPAPTLTAPTAVYVVMVDHQQYLQTLDLTATMPRGVNPLTVQVLVVDWRGFSEVFTPRPQSALELARNLVRQLGLEETMGLTDKPSKQVILRSPWELKEVSRSYLKDFTRVHIQWQPQQSAGQAMYLVTWQVDGGLVRGNLLTNSSIAALSLQPNSVYRIQVSLFTLNSSEWESEPLEVDTTHYESSHLPSKLQPNKDPQLVACLSAAVAALLVTVLGITWRWRHRIVPHSKLENEQIGVPKIYRVFPPAVRLVKDGTDITDDIFSSRDNLLTN